jgi:hypothetical protein
LSPTTPNLVGESVRKKGDSKRLVMPEPRYLEVIKKYLSLHPDERPLEEIRGTLSEYILNRGTLQSRKAVIMTLAISSLGEEQEAII